MTDETAVDKPRRKARQHNISLQSDESLALRFLAETQGRYANKSAVVGALITDQMRRDYGERWRLLVKDHFDTRESIEK